MAIIILAHGIEPAKNTVSSSSLVISSRSYRSEKAINVIFIYHVIGIALGKHTVPFRSVVKWEWGMYLPSNYSPVESDQDGWTPEEGKPEVDITYQSKTDTSGNGDATIVGSHREPGAGMLFIKHRARLSDA